MRKHADVWDFSAEVDRLPVEVHYLGGPKSRVRNDIDDIARVLIQPIQGAVSQKAILDEFVLVRGRLLIDFTLQAQASEQIGQAQAAQNIQFLDHAAQLPNLPIPPLSSYPFLHNPISPKVAEIDCIIDCKLRDESLTTPAKLLTTRFRALRHILS